jgi:hypothetical protein
MALGFPGVVERHDLVFAVAAVTAGCADEFELAGFGPAGYGPGIDAKEIGYLGRRKEFLVLQRLPRGWLGHVGSWVVTGTAYLAVRGGAGAVLGLIAEELLVFEASFLAGDCPEALDFGLALLAP